MFFAIALLFDDQTSLWVDNNRDGMARNFPPHVTLKGRFSIAPTADPVKIIELIRPLAEQTAFALEFSGPMYIDGKLSWLECSPTAPGFQALAKLHNACQQILPAMDGFQSYVDNSYEGSGYRPHVTLKWSDEGIFVPNSDQVEEHIRIRATATQLAILSYTADAYRRGVDTLATLPLR